MGACVKVMVTNLDFSVISKSFCCSDAFIMVGFDSKHQVLDGIVCSLSLIEFIQCTKTSQGGLCLGPLPSSTRPAYLGLFRSDFKMVTTTQECHDHFNDKLVSKNIGF